MDWPGWEQWRRLLLLEDYNTRVVLLGATLLGGAAGIVGSFTLLRKRALMGDALSHATLPGIGLAFLLATVLGGDGKSLPVLLLGATLTGLAGVAAILLLRHLTRLKEDTALGAVLSVFFGAGLALLGVIQQMRAGHAAGLESFIYGKTASMSAQDAQLIAAAAAICIGVSLLLFKELKLLCFDAGFAGSRGFPVLGLDLALMGLVVLVTIVGLQAVGLILMIALLVMPAAAARFWTDSMWSLGVISGVLGAVGGCLGAAASALVPRLPSGAMIVLVCAAFFLASMTFGTARGLLVRWLRRAHLQTVVNRQHLLRAMYELLELEGSGGADPAGGWRDVSQRELLSRRSWSPARLRRSIRRAARAGLVEVGLVEVGSVGAGAGEAGTGQRLRLTAAGMREAVRLTRQHRLWELYLITYADIAPSRVDREADAIEHVLEPDVVARLESLLDKTRAGVPASPHQLAPPVVAGSEAAARGNA
ncbi:MAG: metal ABC transporter permease [Pirellulaceae bacterium]|nr:metal ABC transporter permease [Pirellulaceae bacterium]